MYMYGENAISSPMLDLSELHTMHSTYGADTRVLFHALHAIESSRSKVKIHAADTDVVILATAVSSTQDNSQIWVAFGYGVKLHFIPCIPSQFMLAFLDATQPQPSTV